MKTLTILVSILTAMFLTTAVMASDADSTRVEKKIVKTVLITDDGKVMVDSTFINEDGKVTVHVDSVMLNGRCHRGNGDFRHFNENDLMFGNDEMGEEFNVMVEMDGDSTHTMVIGNPNCKRKIIKHSEGNMPECKKMMIYHDAEGMPCPPPPPVPPVPGQSIKHKGMIDLNDPSIISYEKKIQKDGTEKITIIRRVD